MCKAIEQLCVSLRPLQNPHLRRISALCAARSFAYLFDMSALAALLRLELHPHLRVLQRSQPACESKPLV
ncbi:signal peptidase [Neisseria sp. 74A18]|uniref:signal peptidase n=1 Tax=Neisseria sp. 74A18 TaxID=1696094 RepID=UPI001E635044|nr:signal peptidase [Neisseria sp. 74A18]